MLFTTVGQGWLFLLMLDIGLLCAIVDEGCKLLKFQNKNQKIDKNIEKTAKNTQKIEFLAPKPKTKAKNKDLIYKIFNNIFDAVRVLIWSAIFYVSTLLLNYGEVRFYLILAFVAGFCLERTILVPTIQKLRSMRYNKKILRNK